MFIIFDTETTGLPKDYNAPLSDSQNWPRLVQLAWQIHDEKGDLVEARDYIVKPEGFTIPYSATKVHGITDEKAAEEGVDLTWLLQTFNASLNKASLIVGHNIEFDRNIAGAEYYRTSIDSPLLKMNQIDTMDSSIRFCALPGGKGGGYKRPNLTELHLKLFDERFDEAHNATADVEATARCFLELLRRGVITSDQVHFTPEQSRRFKENNPDIIQPAGVSISPQVDTETPPATEESEQKTKKADLGQVADIPFNHLHVHTQYSILDGAAKIKKMLRKAGEDHMKGLAITDHGNMFGAKDFHASALDFNREVKNAKEADIDSIQAAIGDLKISLSNTDNDKKRKDLQEEIKQKEAEKEETNALRKCEPVKPIIGCEVYIARHSRFDKKDTKDKGYHLVLLAKNFKGYQNLMKLVSLGFLEGFYYHPRIDKELLKEYKEGLIALSGCLGGEVAQTVMHQNEEAAKSVIKEYREIFGEDFYLEMMRHPNNGEKTREVYNDQLYVNGVLQQLSKENGAKLVATNDSHFIEEKDAAAHDRLICISTGKDVDDPNRMQYTRQEWFKTQNEMKELFADVPEAIKNTNEVIDKVETYELDRDPIMPEFGLPEEFSDYNEYLRHVTFEGARERWGEISNEIKERLDFELETIKNMGFPSYFLIVWDLIKAAREMDVSVGPGRGSAAGSAVAYALHITEIDPIKYDLLFERFLNPDRISMPDIDIDFDDDGREKVLEWVVNKYGEKRVAHIITFGSMAAKSAIRDVARVQGLPLSEADYLAKLVPEKPGMKLDKAIQDNPDLKKEFEQGKPEIQSVLQYAKTLEGSVRNKGTHACGIIIGRDDLENYVPITTTKDSELTYVTQFDGNFVEDIGLLKMDFLGLKTLSIIKDAVKNIELSRGEKVDIANISLDDEATYELYSRGETTGLFQFESDGMKKYLKDLKPSRFEDLIAMNALYRPGPMEYIPDFIKRKHGAQEISYDVPEMEEYLEETYGITVYQEQVMRLARKLAGFSRGQSDTLRKAMGKKKKKLMAKLKVQFFEGCKANGFTEKKIEKIWNDWEAFAEYAFNKSHATCYSYISYQTAYLKAHYPAEYMAAVLSRHMETIEKVTFFIEECRRMGIKVLGPDVNESYARFTVNQNGEIRFGMVAIKGVGEGAVEELIKERDENGEYQDILDLVKRVNLKSVNRKTLEALALAGGLDSLGDAHRAQYFYKENESNGIFLEKIIRYGVQYQQNQNSSQTSLFGDTQDQALPSITFPNTEPWGQLEQLKKEKEVIGFYLSGHPLDDYSVEREATCNASLKILEGDRSKLAGKEFIVAGIVSKPSPPNLQTRQGKPFGRFTLEDYESSADFFVFDEMFSNHRASIETEGTPLLVRFSVEKRKGRNNNDAPEYSPSIKSIQFLGDVLKNINKKVAIDVKLEDVTPSFVEEISEMVEKYPGKHEIIFNIKQDDENINLQLPSLTKKVDFSTFIKELNKMEGLKYHLV
ncbi:MAG: DNA polymerase III subunit alpha [Bacteroidales bacterium]|nr:DNA polymerase III subunit alpha [Bacteroidales bacterium]MCF8338396.1 DNA polymerase III subunit alpha [Bacteroidales bacterium]